jgi:hypothetical protein
LEVRNHGVSEFQWTFTAFAETPSELLVRIRVIMAEIPRETLNAVFLEWMERLQKCAQVDGEYVG